MTNSETTEPIESGPTAELAKLATLRPEYRATEHARYLAYLTSALAESGGDAARNVALTGGYGVGKSSVLQKYAEDNKDRVATISLSTISPAEHDKSAAQGSTKQEHSTIDTESVSAQIQKSIVKQLLYSRPPASTPGSRFRRIEEFDWKRATGIAFILLIPVAAAAYLLDSLKRPEAFFRWEPIPVLVSWIVGAILTVVILVLLQRLMHFRFRLERFSAGPATIAPKGAEETYFDLYLDEIVYFFQRSKLDVVIFEDLDRFNDAEIFEQLRELNTVLNSAKQIEKRPVRFVYAVRDSLFETAPDALISPSDLGVGREVAGEAAPSVRAKFFDLIIPMVPFATHRTSRDLLRLALRPSVPAVDPALERLVATAAPYLQDMRVITNVGNEFRIFSEMVLNPSIDGLRPEALAAMVLYKNVYLADYEKVRGGSSDLDAMEKRARSFVKSVAIAIDKAINEIDGQIEVGADLDLRAEQAFARLESFLDNANSIFEGGGSLQYLVDGVTHTIAQLRSPAVWGTLSEPGHVLSVRVSGTDDYPVDRSVIESVLGSALSPAAWEANDLAPLRERRSALIEEKRVLLSSSISRLLEGDRTFEWTNSAREKVITTFSVALDDCVKGELARALIRAGFIDWNYSLYISRYIGDTTSANALNYAIKYVQPGEQNFFYGLSDEKDINGLIAEVGDELFQTRSAFNVDLAKAMLADARFAPVLDLLSIGDANSAEFFDAFVNAEGADSNLMTREMSKRWPGVLVHLADMSGDVGRRVGLVDEALQVLPPQRFESSPELRSLIESHYADMTVFGPDASLDQSQSDSLADELSRLGVELDKLDLVPDPLKSSLAAAAAFKVNAGNLRIATGDGLSLEEMTSHGRVVEHVLTHLDEYLDALGLEGAYSVTQPDEFANALSMTATQDPGAVEPIARAAQPDLRVHDIDSIAAEAWVGVAASDRLTLSARNVRKYLETRSLDAAMISTLENQRAMTVGEVDPQPERRELARIIVNCADLSVDARVDLVRDLQLDRPLELSEVNLEEGDLFGALVSAALIPDTAETYVALSALSWESKEKFIVNSNDFSTYVPQLPLTDGDISAIVNSQLVPSSVRDKLVTDFDSLSASVGAQSARDLIQHAESSNLSFTEQGLDVIADAQPGERPLLSAIAAAQTHVDDYELLGLLRRAGGDTAHLAERGNRPLTIQDVPLIEQLLQRLDAQELVSTFSRADDNTWRVNMRRP